LENFIFSLVSSLIILATLRPSSAASMPVTTGSKDHRPRWAASSRYFSTPFVLSLLTVAAWVSAVQQASHTSREFATSGGGDGAGGAVGLGHSRVRMAKERCFVLGMVGHTTFNVDLYIYMRYFTP